MLVVGPSGVFMRYIERVLPSLGETAVALRSLGEVVDGVRATRHDEPAVADVKGSARMAELMRRTARQQAPGQPEGVPRLLARRRDRARPRPARPAPPPADERRAGATGSCRGWPTTLLDAMWRQVRGERGRERGREAFDDDMLSTQAFVDFAIAVVAAARRRRGARLAARPRVPGPRRRGRRRARGAAAARRSRGHEATCRCRSRTSPLLDELRYAARRRARPRAEEDHELDDLRSRAVDLQELTTAAEREYAPAAAPGRRRPTGSRTTASPTC